MYFKISDPQQSLIPSGIRDPRVYSVPDTAGHHGHQTGDPPGARRVPSTAQADPCAGSFTTHGFHSPVHQILHRRED